MSRALRASNDCTNMAKKAFNEDGTWAASAHLNRLKWFPYGEKPGSEKGHPWTSLVILWVKNLSTCSQRVRQIGSGVLVQLTTTYVCIRSAKWCSLRAADQLIWAAIGHSRGKLSLLLKIRQSQPTEEVGIQEAFDWNWSRREPRLD